VTPAARTAIVFGKTRVAVRATEVLVSEGYRIHFVIPSRQRANDTLFTDWAQSLDLRVQHIESLDDLLSTHADLGISAYFDRIFRQRHIDMFDKLLNVHNSLLPRYRGVRPVNWALKNGEAQHGVSLHVITAGIDEGAILDQEAFGIDPDVDEVRDVYTRCLDAAEVMLARALPRIWELPALPQDETNASYFSAEDDEKLGDRRYFTRDATGLEQ
jgi:methionyl-tRNA formyltransferase